MGELVSALPGRSDININAAPPALIAVLLQNPVQARSLAATRDRQGFLTPRDIASARAILPPGVSYRSDLFRVVTTVRIGGTLQSLESLLQRRRGPGGRAQVAVIERRNPQGHDVPPPPG
jgi:general secretion pathway protein K